MENKKTKMEKITGQDSKSKKISKKVEDGKDNNKQKEIVARKIDIEKGIFLDPLITEKAVMSIERNNQITFIVDKRNGKKQIKNDVEDVFGVKVEKIRTSIRGQEKHAYVKLKKEFLAIDIATKLGII